VTDSRLDGGGLCRGVRQAWHSKRRVVRAAWRVGATTAIAAGAALALMHVWIFWDQLTSGRLLAGASALRWTGALVLCAALDALRRRGISLWWGRRAFSLWLLVGLLHSWSASPSTSTLDRAASDPVQEAAATFLLPLTGVAVASLAGLLIITHLKTRPSPLSLLGLLPLLLPRLSTSRWASTVRMPRAPPALTA
jgi:hypothetical protein